MLLEARVKWQDNLMEVFHGHGVITAQFPCELTRRRDIRCILRKRRSASLYNRCQHGWLV